MDAFNITTTDNMKSSLPLSSNAALKEDFEFIPQVDNQDSLKLLRRLSFLATSISAFGLIYNGTSLAYFSSSYNMICTLASLVSLALSTALIFWSSKTLKKEQDLLNVNETTTRRIELFNQALYTTLMFRVGVSIPLIANMFFQGSNTSHYLRAFGATYEDESYQDTQTALNSAGTILPFLEVLLSLIFVQASRTCFPYIKDPNGAITRMIFIGSAILMASSFAMIYAARYASDYQELYGLSFPTWNLQGFLLFGIASAIMSGLVWFMNHLKSETSVSRTTLALGALTVGLALLSASGYANTKQISGQFGTLESLNSTWAEQMAATNIQDIESYGCPSKYLPRKIASDPSFERLWGTGATTRDGIQARYLNIACAELLGNQQASYFAKTVSFGLLNITSSLVILLGFLYFKHIQWRNLEAGSKKDFKWLAFLGSMALVFIGAMIFYQGPLPSENAHLFGTQSHAFNILHSTESISTSVDLPGFNPYGQIFNDLMARKYRFGLLRHDSSTPLTTMVQAEPWSLTLNDLKKAILPNEEQIGFIMLGDKGQEIPYVIIYTPSSSKIEEVLKSFNFPTNTQQLQEAGLPGAHYYVARSKEDLGLTKIAMESRVGPIGLLNELEGNNLLFVEEEGSTDFVFATSGPYDLLIQRLNNRQARFAILKHDNKDPSKINIAEGSPNSVFSDFAGQFDSGKEQVGVMYLGETKKEKPYLVILAPGNRNAAQVLNGFQLPTATSQLEKLGFKGVNYYVAKDKKDIDLTKVVMGSRLGGTISLFGEDDLALAAPSGTYSNVFKLLTNKQYRFIILKHDPVNPLNIKIDAGPWNMIFGDFAKAFIPTQEQVGFIMLGQPGKEQPFMVVYGPQNTKAEKVLDGFQLPKTTVDLQPQGLSNVNCYVAHTPSEINLDNVVLNSKTGRILILAGEEEDDSGLMLAAAGPYDASFQHLFDRKARFVVLSHDTRNYQQVNVAEGNSQSLFSDFANVFENGKEQAGIILLGETKKEKPYLVILAPGNKNAAQVLSGFQLPANTAQLEKLGFKGINYYVAKTKKDIDLTKVVMQSKLSGAINLYQDAALALADDNSNTYTNIFKALTDKKYRFVVLRHDPQNPQNIKVDAAPWNWLFTDFVNSINPTIEQVGIIYLGQNESEKPYIIVFAPDTKHSSATSVLNNFGLPTTTADLENAGLKGVGYYVAHEIKDLDLATVIQQNKVGTISMLNELDNEDSTDELDNEDYADFSVFATAQSVYSNVLKQINDKNIRYAVIKRDPKDSSKTKIETGAWKSSFNDFAKNIDISKEQVGIVVLGQGSSEKPFVVVTAPKNANVGAILNGYGLPTTVEELEKLGLKGVNAYVARDKTDLNMARVVMWAKSKGTVSFFEDGEEIFVDEVDSPYNNLFKTLSNKKYRFAVLKRDPQNPMNIKVQVAPWNWQFSDFVQSVDPNQKQVGIVYLGQTGAETPYLVVFAPKGTTALKVLDSFGLPYSANNLRKAGLAGVDHYYVASEIKDLDLNNILEQAKEGGISMLSQQDEETDQEEDNDDEQPDQEDEDDDMFLYATGHLEYEDYTRELSVLATASNPYGQVFNQMFSKQVRFAVLKHDAKDSQKINLITGPWPTIFGDFANTFDNNKEQVGIIYLGNDKKEKPFLVVYAPKNANPGQVLNGFQLPSSVEELEKLGFKGINYFVARDRSDIDLTKVVMWSKGKGPISFLEDAGEDYSVMAAATSPYTPLFNALNDKKYRFITLKRNPENPSGVKITGGPWATKFEDFLGTLDANKEQAGFVYVGPANQEKLYRVVVAPKGNAGGILDDLQLPRSANELAQIGLRGVPTYVASSLGDLVPQRIISESKANVA